MISRLCLLVHCQGIGLDENLHAALKSCWLNAAGPDLGLDDVQLPKHVCFEGFLLLQL